MASSAQGKLIAYLIVFFGFVMGFVYNTQVDPTLDIEQIPVNFQLTAFHGLDTLKIDYSALTNDQFRQLKVFGDLPVQGQPGGKANPFQ